MNNDEYNQKIVETLAEVVKNSPGLRFGQILFNLNINQFADPKDPEAKGCLCRDIHSDSSAAIFNRMEAVLNKK